MHVWVSLLTGIAVLLVVPVTKERVTVTWTLTVLQVSNVERTNAGTSDPVLKNLLIAA